MAIPTIHTGDRLPPSAWVELTSAYLRARFVITCVAAIASIAGGILNGWVRGPWVLLVVLVVMVHAYRIRGRQTETATTVLVLDALTFAAVNVMTGLFSIGLISLTFLMIAASVLERGRRVYILWTVDVILIGSALGVSSLLPLQAYTVSQRQVTEAVGLLFITWAAVTLTRTLAAKLRAADVTRRVAEAELLAKKRRFHALVERSTDGLAVTDAGLKIVELGVQNHRITGYEAEERVGSSILDMVVTEDRANLVSAYRQIMENPRSPALFEARIERRDGEMRTVAFTARNFTDDSDLHGLVFNFHDITDEQAARTELELANQRLAELVRSKDEFIASVSHELRTPLTAVVGMAEILNEETDLDESEREEMHAILATQVRHTSAIVDDLLVAARADIGQVSVVAEPCDLAEVVCQAVVSAGPEIEVEIDVPPDVEVIADPMRLLQVVRNLVTNADRHGGRGIAISVEEADGYVVLSVIDDGSGVPDEDVEKIFEPYHRTEAAIAMPGSIGLGLSVSRILARLMGGDVHYRRAGDMTVFELSIPRYCVAPEAHVSEMAG